jgi:PKD repeat protein
MTKTPFILIAFLTIMGCSKDATTPDISPVSEFTFTVDAANRKIINFQNASHYINSNTKYLWYFGDGDSSFLENPKHTYALEGKYSVVLKVSNGDLIDFSDQSVLVSINYIDSSAIPPIVAFVISQKGRNVVFQNASSGVDAKTTYFWSFGDGDTAHKENPTHQYSADGVYSIVLKVTSNYYSYSASKSIYISNSDIPGYDTLVPMPSFTYYYVGKDVFFINTSSFTSSVTQYTWNFGDGRSDTKENTDHVYQNDGDYNVVLKVKNNKYTVTCTQKVSVPYHNNNYDWNMKPDAKFVYTQEGKGIYFQNASSNLIPGAKYFWTFGDNDTSEEENIFHTYTAAGKYAVVLKVTNDNISDSYSLELTIP